MNFKGGENHRDHLSYQVKQNRQIKGRMDETDPPRNRHLHQPSQKSQDQERLRSGNGPGGKEGKTAQREPDDLVYCTDYIFFGHDQFQKVQSGVFAFR